MSTKQKSVIAGLAILVVGAIAGWSTSRIVGSADATTGEVAQAIAPIAEVPPVSLAPSQPAPIRRAPRAPRSTNGVTIPSGTAVVVATNHALSSKTAQVGDTWSGSVVEPVFRNGRVVIPAGAHVTGTVVASEQAERGERAQLQLAMSSISVNGRTYGVRGSSQAVVAGSPRARNLGAIAGATAAGALIGKAVGGSTKSTVIGAAVGGTAATAAVAASKGYQATIKEGAELTFTTTSGVAMRA